MAVTAPPQPFEERAFFEKMWAQNFERSQVEYQVPVEVLTAATPISYSPFADGNFDAARGNDMGMYNITSNEDSETQNVAQAAFLSRLADPTDQYHEKRKVKGSGSDGDLTVLCKGDNVFGTTVSKSFSRPAESGGFPLVDTVNISIASYRVVEVRYISKRRRTLCFQSPFYKSNVLIVTVEETWNLCAVSCHLPRGKHTRYHWSLETTLRFS